MRLTEFKVPGADLGGIHYLRDIKDADGIVAATSAVKEAGGKVRSGLPGLLPHINFAPRSVYDRVTRSQVTSKLAAPSFMELSCHLALRIS